MRKVFDKASRGKEPLRGTCRDRNGPYSYYYLAQYYKLHVCNVVWHPPTMCCM